MDIFKLFEMLMAITLIFLLTTSGAIEMARMNE